MEEQVLVVRITVWCSSTDIVTDAYKYQEYQNNTVFYSNNSEEMYVGGTDFILRLDTNEFKVLEVGLYTVFSRIYDVLLVSCSRWGESQYSLYSQHAFYCWADFFWLSTWWQWSLLSSWAHNKAPVAYCDRHFLHNRTVIQRPLTALAFHKQLICGFNLETVPHAAHYLTIVVFLFFFFT